MAALSLAERIDQFAGEGEPGRESVQTIRQHAEQVRAVIDGPATIRVDATIDRNGNWTHRPARRAFSFIDISGVLTEFDIRCARVGVQTVFIDETQMWSVPQQFGDCSLVVHGDPGATFSL